MKISKLVCFIFLPAVLMNCSQTSKIDIQGHRGCRGLMPENTIPAFRKAIEMGVNTLELDVVVSQDNIVVVSHEPYMNSEICLDPEGNTIPKQKELNYNLYQMEYESIKQFDCGLKFHPKFPEQKKLETHKPSLDEVLKLANTEKPEIKFNIELKALKTQYDIYTPKPRPFVELVLAVLKSNNVITKTTLQSFDLGVLEEIKKQTSEMSVVLLVDEDENIQDKIKRLIYKPEIISPYYKLLDKETVRQLQSENYSIIPWTVNEIDDMKIAIDWGVNGIITDYPDRLIKILN